MPIHAESVTRTMAGAAKNTLKNLFSPLPAFEVGAGFSAANISRVPDDHFYAASSAMKDLVVWENNGWCAARAAAGASLLQKGNTKMGIAPVTDGIAGVMAIAKGDIKWRVPGANPPTGNWVYHATAVGFPRGAVEPMAIDYLLFRKPVPLSAWARTIGVDVAKVELRSPGNVKSLNIADRAADRKMLRILSEQLDDAAKRGVVDNPFLHLPREFEGPATFVPPRAERFRIPDPDELMIA